MLDLDKVNQTLTHGGLLIPKKTKANAFVTPHGGVALIGIKGSIRNFAVNEDLTGLWADLSSTSKIPAAWYQVLPKTRALVFSFYGETSKHDNSHLRVNNFMLDRLLAVASQFGNIPIMICGDFQSDPDSYSAISSGVGVIHCAPVRPVTFPVMLSSAIPQNTFHQLIPFF